MERLARTAISENGGETPNGMCAQGVRLILQGGDFPGVNAANSGFGSAYQYGNYWNQGDNAARDGLERLNITNPFDAPPGSIIVVKPGANGFNSEHGDIAIAVGGGRFINDGEISYGSRGDWEPGDVLGIYAPAGTTQIPEWEKLAGAPPPPGPVTPISGGASSSGGTSSVGSSGTAAPVTDAYQSPSAPNITQTPDAPQTTPAGAMDLNFMDLLLEAMLATTGIHEAFEDNPSFKAFLAAHPKLKGKAALREFLKTGLTQLEKSGKFDKKALARELENDPRAGRQQLAAITDVIAGTRPAHSLTTGTARA